MGQWRDVSTQILFTSLIGARVFFNILIALLLAALGALFESLILVVIVGFFVASFFGIYSKQVWGYLLLIITSLIDFITFLGLFVLKVDVIRALDPLFFDALDGAVAIALVVNLIIIFMAYLEIRSRASPRFDRSMGTGDVNS